jgi:hypothetical protein
MTRLLPLLLAALTTQAAWAGTASSQFAVRLTVSNGGKCTGETLRQPAEAVVQVVCGSTGPFVHIEPPPDIAPAAFIGRAFRYPAAIEGFVPIATESVISVGTPVATVTEFRMVGDSVRDNHFELLISF